MATNDTSSRRTLFRLAAASAAVAASTPALAGTTAAASPEITAAIAAYWARMAEANAPGAGDEVTDLKCEEMEDAAAKLAALPCRGIADVAAKVVFFVAVAKDGGALQNVTAAEGDVLLSVAPHMLALAGGAA
jgi:hypothetical protein